MTQNLSKEEIRADLGATERDIARLDLIAREINEFIMDSHGEDRSGFKTDAFKYSALCDQARALRSKIRTALSNAQ